MIVMNSACIIYQNVVDVQYHKGGEGAIKVGASSLMV